MSSKKALNKVTDAKKTAESKSDSEESSLKRTQSFSTKSPIAKTSILSSTLANTPNSETRPRMTSTPVSEEERKAQNKAGNSQTNILRNNKEQQPTFRTAALKSQHQRWSFAESQLQQHHHQIVPPGHHYQHQHHPQHQQQHVYQ